MMIAIDLFGRGIQLAVHRYDIEYDRMRYFSLVFVRKQALRRSYVLTATPCGGLEFSVRSGSHTQGWRLRGPVEHFETNY